MLKHGYSTLKINFGYLDCPSCKQELSLENDVPMISTKLKKSLEVKAKVIQMAIEYAKQEGFDKKGPVVTPGTQYYGKLKEYALHQCSFFECNKCNEVYFGGLQDCADAMNLANEI